MTPRSRTVSSLILVGMIAAVWWVVFARDEHSAMNSSLHAVAIENNARVVDSAARVLPTADPATELILAQRAGEVRLRVLTEEAHPIEGAVVRSLDERDVQARTDTLGWCLFVIHGSGPVVVSSEGYSAQRVEPSVLARHAATRETLDVVLRSAGGLAGWVVRPDGANAPGGIWVLAWVTADPPAREELRAALAEQSAPHGGATVPDQRSSEEPAGNVPSRGGLLLAQTGPGGRFRFSTPNAAEHYTLTAAGSGFAARLRVAIPKHAPTDIEVVVLSHYALGVQLLDQAGELVRKPRHSPMGMHSTFAFQEHGDERFGYTGWIERELLGLHVPSGLDQGMTIVELVTDSPRSSVGPLHFNAIAPGFTKNSVVLDIPRSTHGLEIAQVALLPSGEGTGSLELIMEGWEAMTAGTHLIEDHLEKLNLVSDSGDALQCMLKDLEGNRTVIEGIPYGTYSVVLALSGSLARFESEDPVVISDKPSTVFFDLRGLAALELDVVDTNDRPFTGKIQVLVERTDWPYSGIFTFEAPPYRAAFITPATYRARLFYAVTGDARTSINGSSAPVALVGGQTARTKLMFWTDL